MAFGAGDVVRGTERRGKLMGADGLVAAVVRELPVEPTPAERYALRPRTHCCGSTWPRGVIR
jgi:hypothetical protein